MSQPIVYVDTSEVRAGQLDKLTRGTTAKQLALDKQYALHDKGDVARRPHPLRFHSSLTKWTSARPTSATKTVSR